MSIEPYYMLKMQRCEDQVRKEIAASQISHPISDYTPERIERLVESMQQAQRFQWPQEYQVNL